MTAGGVRCTLPPSKNDYASPTSQFGRRSRVNLARQCTAEMPRDKGRTPANPGVNGADSRLRDGDSPTDADLTYPRRALRRALLSLCSVRFPAEMV